MRAQPRSRLCLGVCSKGGSLDKDEFGGIFEEIQMPLTKTELDGVFADIDKDGGGDVRTAVVAALLREAPL